MIAIFFKDFSKGSLGFFAQPLLTRANDFLSAVKIDDKGVRDLTKPTILELLKRGRCICGAEICEGNDAYLHLIEEMNYTTGTISAMFCWTPMAARPKTKRTPRSYSSGPTPSTSISSRGMWRICPGTTAFPPLRSSWRTARSGTLPGSRSSRSSPWPTEPQSGER